ncbi:hypothetical protein [Butyrivibrio sp.]|uniref:hypothetical protein n=1 Tax=Butyrivibrio sp. TaxID=28121 RepID=UPI0025B98A46|nr:hypothetical protein [Butyrivibrio sp.]MBQ9304302.1 hypothetical protein [Butyrivibrio sp.]
MNEVMIGKGIIDDVESVMSVIRGICTTKIDDFTTIRKYIEYEKNTMFYFDGRMNSYMEDRKDCMYMWIDTGLRDPYNEPVMISLVKQYGIYRGHLVGNISYLAGCIRRYNRLSAEITNRKLTSFKAKYNSKAETRTNKEIENEQLYLLFDPDEIPNTEIANQLKNLQIHFEESSESDISEEVPEEISKQEKFSTFEEEITIELLLSRMEEMQAYMDELVATLESLSTESQQQILALQNKNAEYKRVIREMQIFVANESASKTADTDSGQMGRKLLGKHGKILVIGGQELGTNVMHGIAKTFGFDKKDFDFVDYDKVKGYSDRIKKDGRYQAIIFGACPHKTAGSAGYSSVLEMLRQTEGMPFIADARSKSGKLKVTKESFKGALTEICENLKQECA